MAGSPWWRPTGFGCGTWTNEAKLSWKLLCSWFCCWREQPGTVLLYTWEPHYQTARQVVSTGTIVAATTMSAASNFSSVFKACPTKENPHLVYKSGQKSWLGRLGRLGRLGADFIFVEWMCITIKWPSKYLCSCPQFITTIGLGCGEKTSYSGGGGKV